VYLAYDRKHWRAVAIKVLPTRELEVLADSLAALTVELIAERPLLP
jgi:hypothetical protein